VNTSGVGASSGISKVVTLSKTQKAVRPGEQVLGEPGIPDVRIHHAGAGAW